MKPFETFSGIVAPLIRMNIDTDAIIPSREMKSVSKQGLADGLFSDWRYESVESRKENKDFILNQSPFNKATILLSGRNFGCGSSREHAVWALSEWGIKVIIAPSFGSIFYSNCIKNGLLPITLDENKIEIKPSMIQLMNDIKSLGEFKVLINLHSEVQEQIIVKVISQEETK